MIKGITSILESKDNLVDFLTKKNFKIYKKYKDSEYPESTFLQLDDESLVAIHEGGSEINAKILRNHFLIDMGLTHCIIFLSNKILFYRSYGDRKYFVYSKRSVTNRSKIDKLNSLEKNFDILFRTKDISGDFYANFQTKRKVVVQSILNDLSDEKKFLIVQKLFNRIFFIYFLCHKKILTIRKSESISGSTLFNALISESNFIEAIYSLFSAFNNVSKRGLKIGSIDVNVPYLNGSLFGLEEEEEYLKINLSKSEWIDIFSFLNSYHWIIEDEIEGIDDDEKVLTPEILGHVYERSVIEWEKKGFEEEVNEELGKSEKKKYGVYYTPEYITEFMVTNSILRYLSGKIRRNYTSTEDLLQQSKDVRSQILELLNNITVIDPSCGSAAFLIKAADILFRIKCALLKSLGKTPNYYEIKLKIILKNIYGVDILAGAIEIAKLRLWLWLISDYNHYLQVQPLPNIDYNILQGNSLVGWLNEPLLPNFSDPLTPSIQKRFEKLTSMLQGVEQKQLIKISALLRTFSNNQDSNNLDNFTKAYFELDALYKGLHGPAAHLLKQIIEDLRREVYSSIDPSFLGFINDKISPSWRKRRNIRPPLEQKKLDSFNPFHWKLDFHSNLEGFDIVITNPPYVDSERMVKTQRKYREILQELYYDTARGNWDLYIPFFQRAMQVSSEYGIVCFITPSKWLSVEYGKALRTFLTDHLIQLCNCDDIEVFKEAANSPVISFFGKQKTNDELKINYFDKEYNVRSSKPVDRSLTHLDNWSILISAFVDTLQRIVNQVDQVCTYYDVENPFSVSEAYVLKELVYDGKANEKELKLVTTGTIDRYQSLWGKRDTAYIKDKFHYPVVKKSELKKRLPRRYDQSISPKIVTTGIRYFECIYDMSGEIIAGKSTTIIRNPRKYPFETLMTILNSKIIGFYMREGFKAAGIEGGVNFTAPMIKQIPLPKLTDSSVSKLNKLYEYIMRSIDTSDMKSLSKSLDILDDFLYSLYNLSADDIEIIKGYRLLLPKLKDGI